MTRVLVEAILAGQGVKHACHNPDVIETHISWVVLLGEYVYKIKKPVDFGFLNFSTLMSRKHFCEEEFRLNQRTAPELYDTVVAISGSPKNPLVDDASLPIEFAVRMHRFDQGEILLNKLEAEGLSQSIVHNLAQRVAVFHQGLPSPGGTRYGEPEAVYAPMRENFLQLEESLGDTLDTRPLRDWSWQRYCSLESMLSERNRQGFVRECHGDMHLGNIVFINGKCLPFDGIEFSPAYRWIDTISEIAFTVMDLHFHHEESLASDFLNQYLEWTGDYHGLHLLDFYLVYRALVRAKVCTLRALQEPTGKSSIPGELYNYVSMAKGYCLSRRTGVVLMSGVSGSGKTTVARLLAPELGAILIRSDVERKRLYGVDLLSSSSDLEQNIYSAQASERTFQRLADLARTILRAGYPVIVDATFLSRKRRDQFRSLAVELDQSCCIVSCEVSTDVALTRLKGRTADASEAGVRQYREQIQHQDPLGPEEAVISLPADQIINVEVVQGIRRLLSWQEKDGL